MSSLPLASAYVAVVPDRAGYARSIASIVSDFRRQYATLNSIAARPIPINVKIAPALAGIARLRAAAVRPLNIRVNLDTSAARARLSALRRLASRSLTVNVRATGSSASITAIAAAFRRAGIAKDAFAANVASKMPMIRRQLNATARAAANLANLMPNGGNGGGGGALPRRRGFGVGLGGAGAGIGIYGVGMALKKTSDEAAEFENKMQQIKGILDETSGSTPAAEKAFNQLTYGVRQLSKASLGFTDLQVAATVQELAEKGWTLNQTMSATPRIMDLASVANMELAKTAEIVAGTLNAYQLDVSKTGEVTDVLQSSANKSSANLEYLGEALHHTSGFANLMGMNLQETVALLGGMSQSSVKASEAGYAMSTMFQRLINPTTRGTAALKEIDSIFKVTGKKRDEFFVGNTLKKGKMMDFLEVVQDFKNKVGDEHFGSTFSRIVGAKGGKLMQAFAYRDPKSGKSGIGEVTRMRREIEGDVRGPGKQGIVEKQREIVENNFKNTTLKLVAALQDMRISLGTVINSELVTFVKMLTSVVNKITEINDRYDGVISKIIIAAGAMTAFIGSAMLIGGVVIAATSLLAVFGAFAPVILGVAAAIGVLTYGWIEHKNEALVAIEAIILKYRELMSVLIGAAKWSANQAGSKMFDADYENAEHERKQQVAALKMADKFAKDERAARKKKYDEERSAMAKGTGAVPGAGPDANHSDPWDDATGKGKKGKKDNLDIVGIEELHNKIQKNLFGDPNRDLLAKIEANTRKSAEKDFKIPSNGGSGVSVPGGGSNHDPKSAEYFGRKPGPVAPGYTGHAKAGSAAAMDLWEQAQAAGHSGLASPQETAGPNKGTAKHSPYRGAAHLAAGLLTKPLGIDQSVVGPIVDSLFGLSNKEAGPNPEEARKQRGPKPDYTKPFKPMTKPEGDKLSFIRQKPRPELDSMLVDTGDDMARQMYAAQRNKAEAEERRRLPSRGGAAPLPLVGDSLGNDAYQQQVRDQQRSTGRKYLQGMFQEKMDFEGEHIPTKRTAKAIETPSDRLGAVSLANENRLNVLNQSRLPAKVKEKATESLAASNAMRMSKAERAEGLRSKRDDSYHAETVSPEIMKNKQSLLLAKANEKREDEKIKRRLGDYGPAEQAKQLEEDKRSEQAKKATEAGKYYKGGGSQKSAMRKVVRAVGEDVRADESTTDARGRYTTRSNRTRLNAGFTQANLPNGKEISRGTPGEEKTAAISAKLDVATAASDEATGNLTDVRKKKAGLKGEYVNASIQDMRDLSSGSDGTGVSANQQRIRDRIAALKKEQEEKHPKKPVLTDEERADSDYYKSAEERTAKGGFDIFKADEAGKEYTNRVRNSAEGDSNYNYDENVYYSESADVINAAGKGIENYDPDRMRRGKEAFEKQKKAESAMPKIPGAGEQGNAVKSSVQNREAEKNMAKVEELLKTGNEKSDKFIEAINNLQLGYV